MARGSGARWIVAWWTGMVMLYCLSTTSVPSPFCLRMLRYLRMSLAKTISTFCICDAFSMAVRICSASWMLVFRACSSLRTSPSPVMDWKVMTQTARSSSSSSFRLSGVRSIMMAQR